MPSAKKRHEQERVARRRRVRAISIAAVAAGILALVGVAAASIGGGGRANPSGSATIPGQTAPVSVRGGSLPTYSSTGADQAVGMHAPELIGSSFDGSAVKITNDGTPKAIVFLAHWCPHCQAELPRIVNMQEQGMLPAAVDIYAVSSGVNPSYPNYPPSTWLARERWSNPTMADDEQGTATQAFGLSGYPMIVFVDTNGSVVARISGEQEDATIIGLMHQLVS
jgi:cytochrome c biogenesis protein CcmG/thiol:disulfide interchange protein DsbE